MKKVIAGCLLSATCFAAQAHPDSIIVDQYLSPYAGAAVNLSAYNAYMYLDDRYLPSSEGKQNLGWFIGRAGKLYVENVMSQVLMVVQHEFFGHGYRGREYHMTDIGYAIGVGWGWTSFGSQEEWESLSITRMAALDAAGMEANAIFSQQIRENWILQNQVDRREGMLYFITYLDQAEYILGTSSEAFDYGDVVSYVDEINEWYGNNSLTKGKLGTYVLWDYLDPSLYTGLYSMVQYLNDGRPNIPMCMFDIYNYKYTFCGRLLLAPYGPEFQLQNYVITPKDQLWQVNVRYGNNSHLQTYGLDLWTKPIWQYQDVTFGNKLSLWRQPLFLTQVYADGIPNRIGIADFVSASYKMNKYCCAIAEFGYKTAGFIQGIPLGNSWVWRLGFSLQY